MKKVLLEAKNISKIYDLDTKNPFTAMKDISLTVYEGDFICVMGPSGSGKSTLINKIRVHLSKLQPVTVFDNL